MEASEKAVLNTVFSVTLLVCSVAIAIYHLVSIHRHRVQKDAKGHICASNFLRKDPSILFSYILCGIAVVSGISFTLDSWLTSALCPYVQYYGPSLYSLFKTVVYLILGVRIWISFKGSMYEYSARRMISWGALLSFWTAFNIVAGNLTVEYAVEEADDASHTTKCLVNPSMLYIASQAMLDLVAGSVSCVLFVSPICKLYKVSAEHADALADALKIKAIAHKQCMLSMIAIVSSLVAMGGLGAVSDLTPVFVSCDMLLSTLCVILMYKWNATVTTTLFWCCVPALAAAARAEESTRLDEQRMRTPPTHDMTDSSEIANGQQNIKTSHPAGHSSASQSHLSKFAKPSLQNRFSQTQTDGDVGSQHSVPSAGSTGSAPSTAPSATPPMVRINTNTVTMTIPETYTPDVH